MKNSKITRKLVLSTFAFFGFMNVYSFAQFTSPDYSLSGKLDVSDHVYWDNIIYTIGKQLDPTKDRFDMTTITGLPLEECASEISYSLNISSTNSATGPFSEYKDVTLTSCTKLLVKGECKESCISVTIEYVPAPTTIELLSSVYPTLNDPTITITYPTPPNPENEEFSRSENPNLNDEYALLTEADLLVNESEKNYKTIIKELTNLDLKLALKAEIFPNPATNSTIVQITLETSENINLEIFNITGLNVFKSVLEGQNGVIQKSLDLAEFTNGIYFVKASTSTEVKTIKLIVEK